MNFHRDQDTICAVSTPPGRGGISVVRVSGKKSWSTVRAFLKTLPSEGESHKAYFGLFKSGDETIDEVLVTYFAHGRSFTGEETCEISCHGSPVVVSEILRCLTNAGLRSADRGEFTYRAFMNNRIDLVQAESIVSMIESQSLAASKQAARQLQGGLSHLIERIESSLTWCLAHIEAGIDFATENLEYVSNDVLVQKLTQIAAEIEGLAGTFRSGRLVREGVKIALIGAPNVGKSSLLNCLMGEERAIVTEIAGTTRDVIEDSFSHEGLQIKVLDTAGIRESIDRVETLGIERSLRASKEADLCLFVFDHSNPKDWSEPKTLDLLRTRAQDALIIFNKADTADQNLQQLTDAFEGTLRASKIFSNEEMKHVFSGSKIVFISALDKRSAGVLKSAIYNHLLVSGFEDSSLVSHARQFELLSSAGRQIRVATESLERDLGAEFVALELKESLMSIQQILGKSFDDQIMDRVFKEFCIGK
ncbi:MAG: tRNA uridine-5-carboxymethylaminomethyl(34) synthesis GTPase MnmE [Pseudobdellovibrionaceae bacterium]